MSEGCVVTWNGDKVISTIENIAAEALWLAGQDAIAQSINKVPLETGTLRRSGVVTMDERPDAAEVYANAKDSHGKYSESAKSDNPVPTPADSKRPKVVVSYNTPYAIWLHEINFTPRPYKFLFNDVRKKREKGPELENGQFRKMKWRKVAKPAVGEWKWLEKAIPIVLKRMRSGVYLARARRKAGL